ncbi:hypothetical protein NMY22_g14212 [Coprinellus aureogranulatus]|nr:hypothetical protein NMY22_g14212 [Coprinellus aureogranulatus]
MGDPIGELLEGGAGDVGGGCVSIPVERGMMRLWGEASAGSSSSTASLLSPAPSLAQSNPGNVMDLNFNFKLPPDIVGYVLKRLDPVDIIAMRATCRSFYRVANSRSIWMAALDRVCEQHGIFKPTFPLEKMTLADLEHAASGPHRFVKFVNASSPTEPNYCIQPYLTRQMPCRKKAIEAGIPDGLYQATCLALIPGGRFLVTSGSGNGTTKEGMACLWDLGYNMHRPAKPYPIATIATGPSPIMALSACASSDGKSILIAIVEQYIGSTVTQINIFSVNPLHRTPQFVLRHTQRVPWMSCLTYLDEPIAIARTDGFLCVYNCAERTGCQWACPSPPHTLSAHLYSNSVISMDNQGDFVVWNIPDELPPLLPDAEPPIIPNPPMHIPRLREHGVAGGASSQFTGTPSCQRHLPPHLCYTVDSYHGDDDPGSRRVVLYSLRNVPASGKNGASVPHCVPVAEGFASVLGAADGEANVEPISPLPLCNGQLVLCSLTRRNGLVASVLPIPRRTSEEPFQPRWATLVDESDDSDMYVSFNDYNVGFCPMSGRIVHPAPNHNSETSIHISDFLLPLEER